MQKTKLRRIIVSLLATVQIMSVILCTAAMAASPTIIGFNIDDTAPEVKKVYAEGETFDPTGYSGVLTYSDYSIEILSSSNMTYVTDTPLLPSTREVTFKSSKTTKTAKAEIKVLALWGLESNGTYKTDYYAGSDIFDPTGLSFTAVFKSNVAGEEGLVIRKEISLSDVSFSVDQSTPLTSDMSYVTASYTLGSTTVICNIPVNVRSIQTLTVTKYPEGTYYEGLPIWYDESELEVEALYTGEATPRKITEFTIDNLDAPMVPEYNAVSGKYECTYTVRFDNKTTSFTVNALPLIDGENIKVTSLSGLQEIYPNNNNVFNESAVTVTAIYNDGSALGLSKDVTDYTTFTYPAVIGFGDTVKATFAGMELDLSAAVKVHTATIEIIGSGAKADYKEGDKFDPSAFRAIVRLDNGSIETLNASSNNLIIDVPETLSISTTSVTFSWFGLEYKQPIRVSPDKKMSISISTPPKTTYFTNIPVSIEGMVVELSIEGQSSPTLLGTDMYTNVSSSGYYTTIPAKDSPIPAGTTEIIVRYFVSDTVYYDAVQPVSVEDKTASYFFIKHQPDVTYDEGSNFSTSQLLLTLVYNDGTTAEITSGFTVNTDPLILPEGVYEDVQTISRTISYSDLTPCKINIKVRPKVVTQIAIATNPDKKTYAPGERFDPTGMTVVITYEDSDKKTYTLPDGYYTYTTTPLNANDRNVTISFRGVSTECQILVNNSYVTDSTAPVQTTDSPKDTSGPVQTSAPETTSTPEETTKGNQGGGKTGSDGKLTALLIIIIVIIVAGIVVLVLYYKRNFS